jgi:hypothetical protein
MKLFLLTVSIYCHFLSHINPKALKELQTKIMSNHIAATTIDIAKGGASATIKGQLRALGGLQLVLPPPPPTKFVQQLRARGRRTKIFTDTKAFGALSL